MLHIINEKHIMQLIDNKTKRNKSIFQDIANELKNKNVVKSDVQIRNKFKSLKSDFFKAKRNNNKSGAKRQTSEHFELLDQILGHRPVLEAEGVDVAEMDIENMDVLTEFGESTEHTEKEKSSNGSQDELTEVEVSASNNNLRSFKRASKEADLPKSG
ncbi:PREDICTED: uncharacterized protein LOC108377772 isoform X2 [Rhagoletis zephyria]|uniref:uncharacterized protein LOC108377772 isoform X2 n=1 Tax=Rhagoletis zephyria TaxID=28612 RepID=UPI0008114193|nr:PREDICTED: uncharacterized protein LOC108377772 isoform X2 [Rhagoletis zephyria]